MSEAPRRKSWQRVDGVVLLDKPLGLSSNAALQQLRRLYSAAKAGHTGTLDPMASGLLPVCLGDATKFSQMLLDADKAYTARVRLGIRTSTGDAEGEVIASSPVSVDDAALSAVLARFRGGIAQVPPMYSALKRDGKPLYQYARAGIELERSARTVFIHALHWDARADCDFDLHVRCSKGTYIRTLAEDIGAALGCGAHLIALRRTGIGPFTLERAVTLEGLASAEQRQQALQAVDLLVSQLPAVQLEAHTARSFLHGQAVPLDSPILGLARVFAAGSFLGLGEADAKGVLAPRRLVAGAGGDA